MKNLFFLLLFLGTLPLKVNGQAYRIYFKDKGSSQQMMSAPATFLSPDALERKALRQVPLSASDLPVAREYLQQLRQQGLAPEWSSRWFNYALVGEVPDTNIIKALPFVKRLEPVHYSTAKPAGTVSKIMTDTLDYGIAANQIEMLAGDYLHDRGWQGQGMRIAVLDGGFTGARGLMGLDSLWNSGRVKDTYNFVTKDSNIFNGGSHGTLVISVLAGYIDSLFAGSAIAADYYLYQSELEITETVTEMDNWLMAAERADSLGVDVITSSLGYNKFDGGIGDYDYKDMDGNTTLVTRAADMAAAKGMLVVVSAGNEGNDPWERITAPADGDSVLAIGGVMPDGSYVDFSSRGPTADGRIKPDVSAQALATAIISGNGPTFGNGTSFSCPIVSGLAACLWQSNNTIDNMAIFEAIRSNASQFYTPDNKRGFGIANFKDASWSVSENEYATPRPVEIDVYPNPLGNSFFLKVSGIKTEGAVEVVIYDLSGKPLHSTEVELQPSVPVSLPAPVASGQYILSLTTDTNTYLRKIVK